MSYKYYFLILYNDNKLTSVRHAKHKKKCVLNDIGTYLRRVCDYIILPVRIREECV